MDNSNFAHSHPAPDTSSSHKGANYRTAEAYYCVHIRKIFTAKYYYFCQVYMFSIWKSKNSDVIFKFIEKLAFRKAFSYRLWIEVRQTIFKQMNFQNCTSVGNFEKWLSLRITFPTFARKMVENVDSLFFCLTLSGLLFVHVFQAYQSTITFSEL